MRRCRNENFTGRTDGKREPEVTVELGLVRAGGRCGRIHSIGRLGRLNKQIAADLGTGGRNNKPHRAHLMEKMGVESLADLVRAAERLGLGK